MFSSFAETAADPLSVPVLLFLLLPSLDTLSKVYFQAVKNLVSANVLGESASSPLTFSFCLLVRTSTGGRHLHHSLLISSTARG